MFAQVDFNNSGFMLFWRMMYLEVPSPKVVNEVNYREKQQCLAQLINFALFLFVKTQSEDKFGIWHPDELAPFVAGFLKPTFESMPKWRALLRQVADGRMQSKNPEGENLMGTAKAAVGIYDMIELQARRLEEILEQGSKGSLQKLSLHSSSTTWRERVTLSYDVPSWGKPVELPDWYARWQ